MLLLLLAVLTMIMIVILLHLHFYDNYIQVINTVKTITSMYVPETFYNSAIEIRELFTIDTVHL